MRKFSKKRRSGARKYAQARWQGLAKILSLVGRAKHSLEVEPVVDSFHAVDILASSKSL